MTDLLVSLKVRYGTDGYATDLVTGLVEAVENSTGKLLDIELYSIEPADLPDEIPTNVSVFTR